MSFKSASTNKMIEVRGVGRRTLTDVSFTCPGNQITSIVGPSGCGKSTLLRIMAGLEQPDRGSVVLGGEIPRSCQARGEIGFAFQSPTLMPWRTVRQNIRLPLELLRRAETSELDDVVKLTELQKYESQLPDELSGGQAQRASLARALVTHPPFLFLDEPFTGLDFLLRRKLNEALLTWIQTINATTVLVTHDPREAVFLSDYIIVLGQPPTKVLMARPVPLSRPRPAAKPSAEFEKFCSVLENTLNPHIN